MSVAGSSEDLLSSAKFGYVLKPPSLSDSTRSGTAE